MRKIYFDGLQISIFLIIHSYVLYFASKFIAEYFGFLIRKKPFKKRQGFCILIGLPCLFLILGILSSPLRQLGENYQLTSQAFFFGAALLGVIVMWLSWVFALIHFLRTLYRKSKSYYFSHN